MIRFNALTGHEQRRFLADWRTPEQRKAEQPSYPLIGWGSFSADGRTLVSSAMELDLRLGRRDRHDAPQVPAAESARLPCGPVPRRPDRGDLGYPLR